VITGSTSQSDATLLPATIDLDVAPQKLAVVGENSGYLKLGG
jgi:hypothetical protein